MEELPSKILFVGTSHVAAIRRAALALESEEKKLAKVSCLHLRDPHYSNCFSDDGSEFIGALGEDICRHIDDGFHLFSCIGGNAYNILGLIESERPFDFILGSDGHSPERELVPLAVVRSALARRDRRYLLWIAAAAKFGSLRHVFAPPPVRSSKYILEHSEAVFRENGLEQFGVAPASLRLKLWTLQCQVQADFLKVAGVDCIAPPADACDPDGFLQESFAAFDASHGNANFGKRVISLCASLAA